MADDIHTPRRYTELLHWAKSVLAMHESGQPLGTLILGTNRIKGLCGALGAQADEVTAAASTCPSSGRRPDPKGCQATRSARERSGSMTLPHDTSRRHSPVIVTETQTNTIRITRTIKIITELYFPAKGSRRGDPNPNLPLTRLILRVDHGGYQRLRFLQ
jgi:hypothetical protein